VERKLRSRNSYSLGKFLAAKFNEESLTAAAEQFEEAIEADSDWSLAHAGLANVYALQAFLGFRRPREVWPLVRAQAEATLHLDELSSEAHLALGMVHALLDWRWSDADLHFQKAMERDSYSGAGHLWRALVCLIPTGKITEAQRELRRAHELAPAPFLQRQHEPQRARVAPTLGFAYGVAGETEQAYSLRAELRERRYRGAWVGNYEMALIETGLGNQNAALALLHEALREKEPAVAFLSVDPRMESLRTASEFSGLVHRIVLMEGDFDRQNASA
jgi:tetratricopeptide (TPR) repeat protein